MRELHFAVERAGLLAEGEVIDEGDLPPEILERTGRRPARRRRRRPAPAQPRAEDDEGPDPAPWCGDALEQAQWRRGKAAEILGVSPRTLYRWMKRLDL